jgi:hypothetical protein
MIAEELGDGDHCIVIVPTRLSIADAEFFCDFADRLCLDVAHKGVSVSSPEW